MWGERIREYFNRESMPNQFSQIMGQLIREAREAKGFSQEELAELTYKSRPSISDMERGKMYPDIVTMLLLAYHLERPLSYFIPKMLSYLSETNVLTDEETELLFHFRRIRRAEQRRIALSQIRAIAEISDPHSATG